MSAVSPSVPLENRQKEAMNPRRTLLVAWIVWFVMLTIPFVLFLAVLFRQNFGSSPEASEAVVNRWFIGSMIFCGLAVPAAFFLQARAFKGYWQGHCVEPRAYLRGMITIWASLELSGLIALIGCWATRTMIPTMLPALIAFMLFVMLWPNGHAMTRPLVSEHDGADYEEPR